MFQASCQGLAVAFVDFSFLAFRAKKAQIPTPERISNVEMTSACVGWKPNISSRVFTLIFSIKNRSSPFKIS